MDKIVIVGTDDWDGRYPFDLERSPLTSREWGWINDLAHYLPLTIQDGFGDPKLVTAFAAIALRRAGSIDTNQVPAVFDELLDVPFGEAIILEAEPEGDDAVVPPPQSLSLSAATSGGSSPTSSETPASPPKPTGNPASATSVSALARSAN